MRRRATAADPAPPRLHPGFPPRRSRKVRKEKKAMARRLRRTHLVALAAVVGLGLTACGGGGIADTSTATGTGGADCGDLRIAVNPWTGYVSNAHVVGQVAKEKLGCNV